MSFPLAEWIDRYSTLPHHLGGSGFRGQLRRRASALAKLPPPDPDALRRALGRVHGVTGSSIFLTHGAAEADFLALAFLRHAGPRAPRVRVRNPEYPPLLDVALRLGYRRASPRSKADVSIRSEPNNPEGLFLDDAEREQLDAKAAAVIVDETFRELSGRPSRAREGDPRVWVTGSFTKIYGADDERVGFVIPPPALRDGFDAFHGVVLDQVPAASVQRAQALLADREAILGEARDIFRTNLRALRERAPEAERLAAPLWFDRGGPGDWGDRVARSGLRHGVLVCPGSFFGDPRGVRVSLTKRSFPEDLAVYWTVRTRLGARDRGKVPYSRNESLTPRRTDGT